MELYADREGVHLLALHRRGHGKTEPLGAPILPGFDTFADDVVVWPTTWASLSSWPAGITAGRRPGA